MHCTSELARLQCSVVGDNYQHRELPQTPPLLFIYSQVVSDIAKHFPFGHTSEGEISDISALHVELKSDPYC